jgi:hypothetical protein
MGRGRITRALSVAACIANVSAAAAAEFRHVGDFLLQAHFKLTGEKLTPIPMKPIAFRVYTDGVKIKVSAEGDEESHTTFEIYRSDGIGRQRSSGGALEVIPGLQATSNTGGVLRHLRLSAESMTITTFPGVSDQTIVSHSVAAEPVPASPLSTNPSPVKP